MKRLFSLLLSLCVAAVATAQVEQAIIIDKATFKAINSDMLTGVNIDPIAPDSSRRPCARIKMKINRMTREEIDGLEMRIRTNNECTKCKTADYDNGLIIEMTAKAESRFYLHHDKFGDSNEVSLHLEADKEYYIEASLNQQFSITVASNVGDAEVYIDNIFKGKTNADGYLTVEGLLAGEHDMKLIYSGVDYNQTILISSTKIFFRQDVDIKSTSSQYLVIKTEPKNALVEINGEVVENSANGASKILKPGAYTYTVTAQNYHPKSGTGIMRGEKITLDITLDPAFGHLAIDANNEFNGAQVYVDNSQRGTLPLSKNIILKSGDHSVRIVKSLYKTFEQSITISDGKVTTITAALEPNFAQVTLKADNGVEIWVDNTKKGTGSWSGKLEIGDHIVECHKASHVSSHHTLTITNQAAVSRTFDPLKPIYGTLNISSTPIGATITIDGEKVGETPMIKSDVLVGKRVVEISMKGYQTKGESVEVVEGKTVEISPKLSTAKSTTTYNTTSTNTTTSTKSSVKNGNILQGAIGLTYGFGAQSMAIGVPIEMRVGNIHNLFNLFVTGKYNHTTAMKKEDSTDIQTELSANQWSLGGNIRANFIRKSTSAYFVDLGALYNFNTSASYKTGSIGYGSESESAGYSSYTTTKAPELLNKNSVSGIIAIGGGGKLMECSLYFQYNFTPTFNTENLALYPVQQDSSTLQTLADIPNAVKMANGNFNIGISIKVYFNGGFFK